MPGYTTKQALLEAFRRAGFANQTQGEIKLLPCPLGTFVNKSVSGSDDLKCLECPAGKLFQTNAESLF